MTPPRAIPIVLANVQRPPEELDLAAHDEGPLGGLTLLSSQFFTQPGADPHDCIGGPLALASGGVWPTGGGALPVGGWVAGVGRSGLGVLSALGRSLTKAPAQQLLFQHPNSPRIQFPASPSSTGWQRLPGRWFLSLPSGLPEPHPHL